MTPVRRVLVLGGTGEANAVCDGLRARGGAYLLARAGALRRMPESVHPLRIGGFGGAAGLARFLADDGTTHLLLATHPFAARMAANAVAAAAATGVPLLRIARPPWTAPAGADWREYAALPELAAALPAGARAFLAIGRRGLEAFAGRGDVEFVYRVMEAGVAPLPGRQLVGAPPAAADAERALLRRYRVDCLVAKNAGGEAGRGKITAALSLGIPLRLLRPPPLPACPSVTSVAAALAWLDRAGG